MGYIWNIRGSSNNNDALLPLLWFLNGTQKKRFFFFGFCQTKSYVKKIVEVLSKCYIFNQIFTITSYFIRK